MSPKLSAGDICNRSVSFAERALSVQEAAQLMRDHHVGCLVVVEESAAGRVVVGMLTDRDIVTAVVAKAVDPVTLRVEDVMSADVVTAREDASVAEMLRTMRRKGLRRLPVVDGRGVLQGLVTLDDLLSLLAGELAEMAQAIQTEQQRELETRPASGSAL